VAAAAALATPALYPAFFFVLEKAVKSAGNAVIPTFPMHRSHGLQGSLKRRRKHPHPTSINGYHTVKNGLGAIVYKWPTFTFVHESGYTLAFANRIAHSGLHSETRGFILAAVWSVLLPLSRLGKEQPEEVGAQSCWAV